MRRRDFIKGIVGSATAWPFAARAQRPERKRRVAVLMGGLFSNDSSGQAEAAALEAGLTELGWKLGSNMPVQAPDKFTLSVNLRAARTIGITLPSTLISCADEVIE